MPEFWCGIGHALWKPSMKKANNPVECLPTFTVRLFTVRLGKRDEVSHERNK